MDITIDSGLTHGRRYVYSLQYHLVWCTKYRKPILTGSVEQCLKQELHRTMEKLSGSIVEMEVMPDHVHIILDCSPQFFIPDAIKQLKGNTARRLFIEYPELKNQLWGGHLWNPSYCAVTVSDRSIGQVQEYIRTQKTK